MSVLQAIANAVSALIFSLIPLFWIAIVYRDHPNPEIVLAFNDLSWILFCVGYPVTTFAFLAIGIVGLNDTNTPRLFPPWLCYFTIFHNNNVYQGSYTCFNRWMDATTLANSGEDALGHVAIVRQKASNAPRISKLCTFQYATSESWFIFPTL